MTPNRSHYVLPPIQLASLISMKRKTIAQYAIARSPYSGAHAEFAAEIRLAERAGHSGWCSALRELHQGGLAYRAPIEMLQWFAAAAPSPYLSGYVVGFIDVRESPHQYSGKVEFAKSMISESGLHRLASRRGALLGGAFMIVHRPGGSRA